MKFRLLRGSHKQSNPDGLESMNLKQIRDKAKEEGLEEEMWKTGSKPALITALRNGEPEEFNYQAKPQDGIFPLFDETNPQAIQVLLQDRMKYQALEGEIDGFNRLGPITQEELALRGLAEAVTEQRENTLPKHLEQMSVAQLRKLADDEEIDLTDTEGRQLNTKAQMVAAIRQAASGMTPAPLAKS